MRRNTRDSLDNIHEQALTDKEKKIVTNISSSRNIFQTRQGSDYIVEGKHMACNNYLTP